MKPFVYAGYTAKVGANLKLRCKVTVKNPSINLKKSTATLTVGGKITLKATVNPRPRK